MLKGLLAQNIQFKPGTRQYEQNIKGDLPLLPMRAEDEAEVEVEDGAEENKDEEKVDAKDLRMAHRLALKLERSAIACRASFAHQRHSLGVVLAVHWNIIQVVNSLLPVVKDLNRLVAPESFKFPVRGIAPITQPRLCLTNAYPGFENTRTEAHNLSQRGRNLEQIDAPEEDARTPPIPVAELSRLVASVEKDWAHAASMHAYIDRLQKEVNVSHMTVNGKMRPSIAI